MNPMTLGYRVIGVVLWAIAALVIVSTVGFWWQQVILLVLMWLISLVSSKISMSAVKADVMDLVLSSEEMLKTSKETIANLELQVANLTTQQR